MNVRLGPQWITGHGVLWFCKKREVFSGDFLMRATATRLTKIHHWFRQFAEALFQGCKPLRLSEVLGQARNANSVHSGVVASQRSRRGFKEDGSGGGLIMRRLCKPSCDDGSVIGSIAKNAELKAASHEGVRRRFLHDSSEGIARSLRVRLPKGKGE